MSHQNRGRYSRVLTAGEKLIRDCGGPASSAAGVLTLLLAATVEIFAGQPGLIANPDYYAVAENGTLNVPAATGLLKNDYSSNGTLQAVSFQPPTHGSLNLVTDGSFTYSPTNGFAGTDTFIYTISNGSIQASATNFITVYHPAPVALPDVYTIQAGKTLNVGKTAGLLANDLSTAGTLEAINFQPPAHGSLNLVTDGSFSYTPEAGFVGTDTFNYTISDGIDFASATGTVVVTAVAPVANNDHYVVRAGRTLTTGTTNGLLANDSNLQGTLESVSYSPPVHGTMNLVTDGSFSYTPAAGFTGTDSFSYTDSNGSLTAGATGTIEVVDTAPVANPDYYQVAQNGTLSVSTANGLLLNDFDPDGDSLEAINFSAPAHGTMNLVTDGSFSYTPNPGFAGTDTANYTLSDGALTANGTVTFEVGSATLIANPDYYAVAENGTLSVPAATGLLKNDSSNTRLLQAVSFQPPTHGTLNLVTDGSFTYTPTNGFAGTDTFIYTISNGSIQTSATNVIVVYHPAPVAQPDVYTVQASTTLNVGKAAGLLANDLATAGTLEAVSFQAPAHGSLNLVTDGSFGYTPNAGFAGNDSFIYTISDGIDLASATATVVVTAVAPVANNDYYVVRAGRTLSAGTTNGVLANDSNLQGTLESVSFSPTIHGTMNLVTDGSFSYTPDAGFTGTDSFSYTDSNGSLTAAGTATIEVVDNAPVANPDYYQVAQNGTLNVSAAKGLLLNDFDPDGDSLEAISFSAPAHGTMNLVTDGSFSYTPDTNFFGRDSVSYTISDGALTAYNTVTIDVIGSYTGGSISDFSFSTNGLTLKCSGVPGLKYDIQRALNLAGSWITLTNQTCPPNGLFDFKDPSPPKPDAFYRLHETGP